MNILYHHRTRGQGAEGAHIAGVVQAFQDAGHQVRILSVPGVSSDDNNSIYTGKVNVGSQFIKKIFSIISRNMPEIIFELVEILYNFIVIVRFGGELDKGNYDLVYERYSLFMFSGIYLANKRNIPILLEVNDSALVHRVRPLFFETLVKSFEKWIFNKCTGLVFISTYFRDIAINSYGSISPSVICPNAANLSKFNRDRLNGEIIRADLNLQNKVICGYVGAFVHWHGIDWFVEKIVPRLNENKDLVLLLVGDGVKYSFIEQIIDQHGLHDRIILTGRVRHEDVPRYLAAMDFGILPDSNLYGSPMKLFEFMAMGKGMVVPAFSPIKEVVDDGVTGWLFPENDRDACVSKVIEISKSIPLQKQVGENAFQYIMKSRQWKHNVDLALSLLNFNKTIK